MVLYEMGLAAACERVVFPRWFLSFIWLWDDVWCGFVVWVSTKYQEDTVEQKNMYILAIVIYYILTELSSSELLWRNVNYIS